MEEERGSDNLVCGKWSDYCLIESIQIDSPLFSKGGAGHGKKSQL